MNALEVRHWLETQTLEDGRQVGTLPHPVEWAPLLDASPEEANVTCPECRKAIEERS